MHLLCHLNSRTRSSLLLCEFWLPLLFALTAIHYINNRLRSQVHVANECVCLWITSAQCASYPSLVNNCETNTITGNNNTASGKSNIQTYMRTCLPIRLSQKYSFATWWLSWLSHASESVIQVYGCPNVSEVNTLTRQNSNWLKIKSFLHTNLFCNRALSNPMPSLLSSSHSV